MRPRSHRIQGAYPSTQIRSYGLPINTNMLCVCDLALITEKNKGIQHQQINKQTNQLHKHETHTSSLSFDCLRTGHREDSRLVPLPKPPIKRNLKLFSNQHNDASTNNENASRRRFASTSLCHRCDFSMSKRSTTRKGHTSR